MNSRIGGFSFFSRDSGGRLIVASYHPRSSDTWFWSVALERNSGVATHRDKQRTGQWHDYYRLPFGWLLIVGQQDWHRQKRAA